MTSLFTASFLYSPLAFLAAVLVLAYGIWAGQRGTGLRGMGLVLGTLIAAQAAAILALPWLLSGETTLWRLLAGTLVSTALGFLPLLVAVLQAAGIRESGRPSLR